MLVWFKINRDPFLPSMIYKLISYIVSLVFLIEEKEIESIVEKKAEKKKMKKNINEQQRNDDNMIRSVGEQKRLTKIIE